MIQSVIASCVALAALVAHGAVIIKPSADQVARTETEVANRQRLFSHNQRQLTACSNSEAGRQLREQNNRRIAAKIEELRADRRRLDAATVLATTHKTNHTDISVSTYPEYLFGDDNHPKCALSPETTESSFYVQGEVFRSNISEDQAGVTLITELQLIDVNTCEPAFPLWIDFWHSNAVGVYSGVVGSVPGESLDASNANTTFLRGLMGVDSYGLTIFTGIIPGHYEGRAPHIGIVVSYSGTFQENKTHTGGSTIHAGEFFFDQDLITEVATTAPYADNTQNLTPNEADEGFIEATV